MTDYPDDFQGSGPMFAAVPAGDPAYKLALSGATTFTVESPPVTDCVFLDRELAESVARQAAGGRYVRWDGMTGREATAPEAG